MSRGRSKSTLTMEEAIHTIVAARDWLAGSNQGGGAS